MEISKLKIIALLSLAPVFSCLWHNEACAQFANDIGSLGRDAIARNSRRLEFAFADDGLKFGAPIFLRLFKDKARLEIWVQSNSGKYKYLRQYKICGANIANIPSGVFFINSSNLAQHNPKTMYISLNAYANIGRKMGISAHCANSPDIGMTDPEIDEIFAIIHKSLGKGQNNIQLQTLPFALNPFNMFTAKNKPNYATLKQLAPIYQKFEDTKTIPKVSYGPRGYIMSSK